MRISEHRDGYYQYTNLCLADHSLKSLATFPRPEYGGRGSGDAGHQFHLFCNLDSGLGWELPPTSHTLLFTMRWLGRAGRMVWSRLTICPRKVSWWPTCRHSADNLSLVKLWALPPASPHSSPSQTTNILPATLSSSLTFTTKIFSLQHWETERT